MMLNLLANMICDDFLCNWMLNINATFDLNFMPNQGFIFWTCDKGITVYNL